MDRNFSSGELVLDGDRLVLLLELDSCLHCCVSDTASEGEAVSL